MNPDLEARAKSRAEALGLKFSPYVTLCVEAELKGFAQIVRDDSMDIEHALVRAREYMTQKSRSIDFEEDVSSIVGGSGAAVERLAQIGGLRVDFLLRFAGAGGRDFTVVLECKYNVRQNYALVLGQGVLLKAHPDIDAVVVVVPYLEGFDRRVLDQLNAHGITLGTPDTLAKLLKSFCSRA